ncbi:hypothetical protein E2562_008368 [Oryza meyeriana var. granulata]|uniref:Ubiquitin-like domain-containing protein n=1 Tax=Oryza meyeriana var. granulata TaxID=110450 RepID=A0A6G1EH08_9ORYZ|nr:hypothetical protein E2562_008368 [Oryza meyeriana var. granulata]
MVVPHVRWAASSSLPPPSSPEVGEEEMGFLYECTTSSPVKDVAAALAGGAALQARLLSLCRCLRDDMHENVQLWWAGKELAMGKKLRDYIGVNDKTKEQVQGNKFLSPRALREHIKNIQNRAVAAIQESPEALFLQQKSSDDKHENVQLWWAGKELAMGKKLYDYIGVNDKTKFGSMEQNKVMKLVPPVYRNARAQLGLCCVSCMTHPNQKLDKPWWWENWELAIATPKLLAFWPPYCVLQNLCFEAKEQRDAAAGACRGS